MGRNSAWSEEKTEQLRHLAGSGIQLREIADRLGATKGQVSGRLFRMGIFLGRQRGRSGSRHGRTSRSEALAKKVEQAFAMYAQAAAAGAVCPTLDEISTALGGLSLSMGKRCTKVLVDSGRIRVRVFRNCRVVEIAATGQTTRLLEAQREPAKLSPVHEAVPPTPPADIGPPHRRCQWIAGEPSGDDSCKCLRETEPGRSFCPTHHARAYIGILPQPDPERYVVKVGRLATFMER